MGKKIGLYGGSFDPVHIGHINLAIEIAEAHQLDEVWFCPAATNPHKSQKTSATSKDRLEMLRLATADIPHFKILDIELTRPAPSYTIDTLRQLIASPANIQDPDHFYLIIGDDTLPHFHQWHQVEEIIKLVPLLIGQREKNFNSEAIKGSPALRQAIKKGLTSTRIMDISSTEIRKRLTQHCYCGHLLAIKVLDYILSHHLYLNDQY